MINKITTLYGKMLYTASLNLPIIFCISTQRFSPNELEIVFVKLWIHNFQFTPPSTRIKKIFILNDKNKNDNITY